jgi:NAD(P)H-hydrate epimerase
MAAQSDSTEADLPRLPPRSAESHKGDYGRALLIGGSRGMAGAIGLAGIAALRGGAGLVTLAVPESCLSTVAGYEPSYMTIGLPEESSGLLAARAVGAIAPMIDRFTAVGLGPGLGRAGALEEIVASLYHEAPRPMVVDADALNALAQRRDALETKPAGPRILTPHPGEFARLAGDGKETAEQLAARWGAIVVLKGHRTLVTDGKSPVWRCPTGNPGLATGGSGDILTGLITALLCQGLAPLEAARLGVYVHGLAGDLAAEELGQVAMIASDLPRFFSKAFGRLDAERG